MGKPEKRKSRPQGKVITDPRFAKVHTDARFQIFPKKQRKVEIDERFKGMLTEERFQHKAPVDKRGRKVTVERKNEDLKKYYRLQDQDEGKKAQLEYEAEGGAPLKKPAFLKGQKQKGQVPPARVEPPDDKEAEAPSVSEEDAPEAESSEEESDRDAEAKARWARARGLAGPSSSSDDADESDSEGTSSDINADTLAEDEDDVRDLLEWGVGAMAANPDEAIPEAEETSRLAVLDLDWERIRATDILVVLCSFLGKGQRIERVTLYPSDFGLAQMAEEAVMGPRPIFGSKQQPAAAGNGSAKAPAAGSESDSEDDDDDDAAVAERAGKGTAEDSGDSDAEVDQRRLRMYERSKLRYYYAIVECDSVATAAHLYKQCDGLEFELTANRLDLRFVPEEQSFEGRCARDSAADAPADYQPPPFFATAALQHTNVKLTWDNDDEHRKRALSKRVTADQLREDDFKAYIASEDEDDKEAEEDALAAADVERYRKLLLEGAAAQQPLHRKGGKDWAAAAGGEAAAATAQDESNEEAADEEAVGRYGKKQTRRGGVDMEVTFDSALENLSQRLAEKGKSKEAKSVWEQYEKRRREKRMAAKQKGKHNVSSSEDEADGAISDDDVPADLQTDTFFQQEDNAFDDPFFQGAEEKAAAVHNEAERTAKREKRRKEKVQREAAKAVGEEEQRRQQAELELLLIDEHALRDQAVLGGKAGDKEAAAQGKLKRLTKKERAKLRKLQKRQERAAGSDDEDLGTGGLNVKASLEDERFAALLNDPDFALDPTDPRFIHTAGTAELATAVAKRKGRGAAGGCGAARAGDGAAQAATAALNEAAAGVQKPTSAAGMKATVASLKNKTAKLKNKMKLRP